MPQPDGVPGFMERHAVDVGISTRMPVLVCVQVHVPGDRFRVHRDGVERMREGAVGAVERVGVSVRTADELDENIARPGRVWTLPEAQIRHFSPFVQGSDHLCLCEERRHLRGHRPEQIRQVNVAVRIEVPAVDDGGVLPRHAIGRQHAGAGEKAIRRGIGEKLRISGKEIGDLIVAG